MPLSSVPSVVDGIGVTVVTAVSLVVSVGVNGAVVVTMGVAVMTINVGVGITILSIGMTIGWPGERTAVSGSALADAKSVVGTPQSVPMLSSVSPSRTTYKFDLSGQGVMVTTGIGVAVGTVGKGVTVGGTVAMGCSVCVNVSPVDITEVGVARDDATVTVEVTTSGVGLFNALRACSVADKISRCVGVWTGVRVGIAMIVPAVPETMTPPTGVDVGAGGMIDVGVGNETELGEMIDVDVNDIAVAVADTMI